MSKINNNSILLFFYHILNGIKKMLRHFSKYNPQKKENQVWDNMRNFNFEMNYPLKSKMAAHYLHFQQTSIKQ